MRTTVSSGGRTSVPAEIRKHFRLTERAYLEWLIDGDLVTVLPVPVEPIRALRGSLSGHYSGNQFLRDRTRERRHRGRSG